MPDKEFFIRSWKVCEEDPDRPDHPVKIGHRFQIRDEPGEGVSFKFFGIFGDGCWNAHVRDGIYADGKITAPVVDDGQCKPAPKTDTFVIERDDRQPNERKIRCKVFKKPLPGLAYMVVEQAGEFGAEDDG